MKFQMKKLVVALALAASAGQAGAAMVTADTGNGDLFLTVWDANNTVSYTRDLNTGILSFLPNSVSVSAAVGGAGYPITGTITPEAGVTKTFATDALFGSAFAGVNQATDPLSWNVVGGDTLITPASSYRVTGAVQIMSTSNQNTPWTMFTSAINTMDTNLNGFMTALNSTGCGTANSCVDTSPGTAPFGSTGSFNVSLGTGTWTNTAGIGNSLYAFYLTGSGGGPSTPAIETLYQNSQNTASWTLNTDGTLTYSLAPAVSAVPVPAAVWLFGSGLLGLVGIARRKRA